MIIRIFHPRKKIVLFIQGFIVFLVAYYIAILFARIFGCTPISAFWEGHGRCVNLEVLYIFDNFASLITDSIILVLPTFLVVSLHLPLKAKIRIAVVLSAGGVATAASLYQVCVTLIHPGLESFTLEMHLSYATYVEVYHLNPSF